MGATMANSVLTPPPSTEQRRKDRRNRQGIVNVTRGYSARVTVAIVGKAVRPMAVHPEEARSELPLMFSQFTTRIRHFGPVALGFAWKVIDDFGK
jgi:hypothetical protein